MAYLVFKTGVSHILRFMLTLTIITVLTLLMDDSHGGVHVHCIVRLLIVRILLT